jgi:3-hydroxybutyryl-CoA dehydrogenase
MGTGIAETIARAGYEVRLYEPIRDSRPTSRARLEESVARAAKAGKLTPQDREGVLSRVSYVDSIVELA